jgi:hypothetical protein
MRDLVKEVGLSCADENKVLRDLNDWEAKGTCLYFILFIFLVAYNFSVETCWDCKFKEII